ncbi:YT521-B-like domain-containing protein [Mycena galopus ATCC 62051]|nr:YT521-B-like domain-containing protein [Mycena galopus ATCC 62051]
MYPYYPPAHAQQHTDGGGGGEFPGTPSSHSASHTYAHARLSTPSSSSAPSPIQPGGSSREGPIVPRLYHPNPPVHRSDWVMWAWNVPSDAVHDELWHFFTQSSDDGGSAAGSSSSGGSVDGGPVDGGGGERNRNGVLSIFLISRSSCAFAHYETEAHLQVAIARFNGVPLRADPRCARLVCRVGRKDDDLRAGVGGQRGSGMHTNWIKAKQGAGHGQDQDSASSASASDPGTPSSDSGSHASTNSGLLQQHFPQRYFILKSLTRDNLDLSVQTGVWVAQKHNQGILDRAFRTSKDVFLVFSVNKSGEFYGYARYVLPLCFSDDFKLQWLCTDRLPFLRTRHIRNPWNHDREIKVSRDGTEVEPTVGQALLEEWRLYLASEAGAVAAGTGVGAETPMPLAGDSTPAPSSRAGGVGAGRAGSRS